MKPQVRSLSARASEGWLVLGSLRFRCALGRSGRVAVKREGDWGTPIGSYALSHGYYRPDRVARPRSALPFSRLRPEDGWCDAVGDRNYNRKIRHPYPASAEHMWREDDLYDVVVVLDHNMRPRIQGGGSAIFMHVARPGYKPTAGCVALRRDHLLRLLTRLRRGTRLVIHP